MKEKNADLLKKLSPEKMKEVEQSYKAMIERQVKAWEDFPEWKKITDDDIKEIIHHKHSPSSDEARGAILKLYSYETPLYDTVNKANQYQDKRAI